MNSPSTIQAFGWLVRQCGGYKKHLFCSMFLSGLSTALGIIPMLCIYQAALWAFDRSAAIPEHGIFLVCAVALVCVVLRFGTYFLSMKLSHIAAFSTLYELRMRMSRHLAEIPMEFFHTTPSGGIKKAMSEDVEFLELVMGHYLPDLVPSLALPFFSALVLFWINSALTLVCLVPLPLVIWMHRKMDMIYQENISTFHDNLERINNAIVEYVRGIKVIKAFHIKSGSVQRYKTALADQLALARKWNKAANLPAVVFRLSVDLGLFLLLPAGFFLLTRGSIAIPELILFFLLGAGITEPVTRIVMIVGFMSRIKEGMVRIQAIFDQPVLKESSTRPCLSGHDIVFDQVVFSYHKDTGKEKAINGLSFCLPEKTITGFVGPSGAGKTTTAQLIARFMEAESGTIRIGGQDIRDIPFSMLMDTVCFVFQDVFLINDTVMGNIRMGKKTATDTQVMEAAEQACADEFIENLEHGYHTPIGENGAFLSGGEKQRIAIARAILKDTPILIFDEATAFTDPENEGRIQQAILNLSREKTVIIIAHRLSSVMHADKLLLFEKGRIRAAGTHKELLEDTVYARMWETFSKSSRWHLKAKEVCDE